jgi:hypothetical protein
MEEQVDGRQHLVAELALIARQIAELAQDDEDGDAAQKPGHHRIGHKARQRAQFQEAQGQGYKPTSTVSVISAPVFSSPE